MPMSYGGVVAANIRAARSRKDLTQDALAARMRHLGFTAWLRQTVPSVEKGRRRVTAEEVLGLALALETTIAALMGASDQDGSIDLPNGQPVGAVSVENLAGNGFNDRAVVWAPDNSATYTVMRRMPRAESTAPAIPIFAEPPDGQ
jgi:hypothetical protein